MNKKKLTVQIEQKGNIYVRMKITIREIKIMMIYILKIM